MNKRRLSYGLLLTFVAVMAGCGDEPKVEAPPQPSATPEASAVPATSGVAETPPAPAPAPEPPPAPAKPAKDKFVGKFVQDFSGDVKDAADADAKKKAGKADKDGKKYNAAMDKAAKALADFTIENTADTFVWSKAGKAVHTWGYKVTKGDDTSSLAIQLVKDGKKDIKKPIDVSISFSDDNTFSFKDPSAKDQGKTPTLVFKRQ